MSAVNCSSYLFENSFAFTYGQEITAFRDSANTTCKKIGYRTLAEIGYVTLIPIALIESVVRTIFMAFAAPIVCCGLCGRHINFSSEALKNSFLSVCAPLFYIITNPFIKTFAIT